MLLQQGTHTCSTLRANRSEPPAVHNATVGNMQVGDIRFQHKDDIMCLAWRDKRVVKMITTIGENDMVEVTVRKRGVPDGVMMQKPQCIALYNKSMSGVDKLDECIQYYPFTRKSVKWTKKFTFYLFQIAMYNAFVIYKDRIPERKCKSLHDFILSVIPTFILSAVEVVSDTDSDHDEQPLPHLPVRTPRAPAGDPNTRLDGNIRTHTLDLIAATSKKKYPSQKCCVCQKRGERKETRYVCCSCHVPLHKGDCFTHYHTKKQIFLVED
ncbi:piggyBac transposable element-derived protein 4-like [Dendronephthya gigantea]|uniref:piggyBac transposable element-derived protein 4-like n=1 Tax=Dendronephthya gigantea TaxID=151771 RepID=UPI00106ABA09|nr:piggyBac transposable element-derived protein 4-like [Dendronephthya gigantea]